MCRTCFESFIRTGTTKSFVLTFGRKPPLETKQDSVSLDAAVREWIAEVWSESFVATSQAILKARPFEFSAAGLSDLDQAALRENAVSAILTAMEREGFTLEDNAGQNRALTVLFGFLNQVQQGAIGVDFYVWTTQRDPRVRDGHAARDDRVFRWDDPPEGGHPTQDFGCRCYARALGIEGYWERIKPSVDAFTFELEVWEGNVDHMYLDSLDNVTVGKGKLLPNANSAVALPFRRRDNDEPASEQEIRAEFELIDAIEGSPSRRADFYREFSTLYLPQEAIDDLVESHVRDDFRSLLRLYPGFGNFPISAQIALWDMLYNLGPRGFAEYSNMRRAILEGDWATAAEESERSGVADARNTYVFDLFMDAAADD